MNTTTLAPSINLPQLRQSLAIAQTFLHGGTADHHAAAIGRLAIALKDAGEHQPKILELIEKVYSTLSLDEIEEHERAWSACLQEYDLSLWDFEVVERNAVLREAQDELASIIRSL